MHEARAAEPSGFITQRPTGLCHPRPCEFVSEPSDPRASLRLSLLRERSRSTRAGSRALRAARIPAARRCLPTATCAACVPDTSEPVAVAVRAGARRRHAAAARSTRTSQSILSGWISSEPFGISSKMRCASNGPVVAADACVVAPDDQVRAAVVLAEHGVQQRFARPGVAHVERVARLDHRAGTKYFSISARDRARAHVGRECRPA